MELKKLTEVTRDGKFFGIKFIRRGDGQIRTMCARVRPPVTGGPGLPYSPADHDLLTVWDIHKKGWRQIPADNVLELRAHGEKIT